MALTADDKEWIADQLATVKEGTKDVVLAVLKDKNTWAMPEIRQAMRAGTDDSYVTWKELERYRQHRSRCATSSTAVTQPVDFNTIAGNIWRGLTTLGLAWWFPCGALVQTLPGGSTQSN
jgi:hypothetical protein